MRRPLHVAIRADASTHIGSGHVVRCLTLADALRDRGAAVTFISRERPGHLCDLIVQRGHGVLRLSAEAEYPADDGDETGAALGTLAQRVDWLVVDHYALGIDWERRLRPRVDRIMAIDDLAGDHDVDLLLDQNFFREAAARYRGRVPPGCTLLLGPHYALLRPEFAWARDRLRARDGTVRSVLVCFGGADEPNFTAAALTALARFNLERIDVVVGASNPHAEALATFCKALPQVRLLQGVENLAELMTACDLSIGGGGGMNWERACLGLPSLVVALAENQGPVIAALLAEGLVLGSAEGAAPDAALIEAGFRLAAKAPALLQGLAQRSADLTDGWGAARVADAMMPTVAPSFRPAREDDCERVHRWRNHPDILKVSADPAPIPLEQHRRWFLSALADTNRRILMACLGDTPVGVVRFDIAGDCATLSVYRAPEGGEPVRGLIRAAGDWAREHLPDCRRIAAEVMAGNTASRSAFLRAGYRDVRTTLILELQRPPIEPSTP